MHRAYLIPSSPRRWYLPRFPSCLSTPGCRSTSSLVPLWELSRTNLVLVGVKTRACLA